MCGRRCRLADPEVTLVNSVDSALLDVTANGDQKMMQVSSHTLMRGCELMAAAADHEGGCTAPEVQEAAARLSAMTDRYMDALAAPERVILCDTCTANDVLVVRCGDIDAQCHCSRAAVLYCVL